MGHGIITRRGIDTSSATATSGKIVAPYTAFVNGEKLTGNVVDYSGSSVAGTPYNVDGSGNFGIRIPNGGVYSQNEIIYAPSSSVGIDAEKIIDGHSILGVIGTQSLYEEDDIELIDLSGYTYKGSVGPSGTISIDTTGSSMLLFCSADAVRLLVSFKNSGGIVTGSFAVPTNNTKVVKLVPNSNMASVVASDSTGSVIYVWQK